MATIYSDSITRPVGIDRWLRTLLTGVVLSGIVAAFAIGFEVFEQNAESSRQDSLPLMQQNSDFGFANEL